MGNQARADRVERAILAAALAVLGGYMALRLRSDHVRIETREGQRLADQARLIDANLGRQLIAMNYALASLQADLPGLQGGAGRLDDRLNTMAGALSGVRTLFVLDAEGRVLASNRAALVGQDLHERAYFKLARETNDPAVLHVSSPIRNALGTYAINLERSVRDRDGRFGGLVAATLDPEYFTTLLNSVNYAPDMWTTLVHGDGTLFLMVPEQQVPAGSALGGPGSMFKRHVDTGQVETVLTGRILTTGEIRMVARRTFRPATLPMDAPLVIGVTRDVNALFAPWRRDLRMETGLFALLVVTASGGLIARQRRRRAADEAKALQEALRHSDEERMSLFFDRQIVGMAITSPDRGFAKVNDHLCRMLGYTREELASRSWADLTHPDDLPRSQADFAKVMAGELDAYSHEKRYVRKDGTVLVAELSVGCARKPDGSLDCLLALVADVTERTRFERELALRQVELETLNRTLEGRVLEGVAQLRAKDQILITQGRQAALGEMLGNIAHQWRQPLNALGMVLVNLRDAQVHGDLDPEGFQRALDKGDALIQGMSTTINDFRDFFRPDKARVPFPALDAVRAAVALVEAGFQAKGIRIAIEEDGEVPLWGLPNEFAQVLVNLLTNARQAIQDTGPSEGLITIALSVEDGWGRIQVRDNGGGIPEPFLGRIFEPYFSTREGGTGIGLYMSRQIIEQSMQGRILARNVGPGAEFTVLAPLDGARP